MISDGIENCLQYLDNFNPKTSNNPFAYFTQIIYYAFVRRIQKEKKQITIKQRMIQESNYDDLALQPGEDREFKNQFTEFLKKNMPVDDPVKKKTTKKEKRSNENALLNDTHFGCRNDSSHLLNIRISFTMIYSFLTCKRMISNV